MYSVSCLPPYSTLSSVFCLLFLFYVLPISPSFIPFLPSFFSSPLLSIYFPFLLSSPSPLRSKSLTDEPLPCTLYSFADTPYGVDLEPHETQAPGCNC
jgi:hypothetical protein